MTASEQLLAWFPDDGEALATHAIILKAFSSPDWPKTINLAVSTDVGNAYLHATRAALYFDSELWAEAEISVDEAMRLSPDEPGYISLKSAILAHLGRLQEAEKLSLEAIRLDPESSRYMGRLGQIRRIELRSRESFEILQETLRLDPTNRTARRELMLAAKLHYATYRLLVKLALKVKRVPVLKIVLPIVGVVIILALVDQIPNAHQYTTNLSLAIMAIPVGLLMLGVLLEFVFDSWLSIDRRFARYISRENRWFAKIGLLLGLIAVVLLTTSVAVQSNYVFCASAVTGFVGIFLLFVQWQS